jgi:hypothetical protein
LAVPKDVVKSYDRKTQQFIGYYGAAPGCGLVGLMDPIYQLYPEELANSYCTGRLLIEMIYCKICLR